MKESTVAGRYAQAFFDAITSQGHDEETTKDEFERADTLLTEFKKALQNSNQLSAFVCSPVFTPAEKKKILSQLPDKIKVPQLAANFLCLLADKNRLGLLPQIAEKFRDLLDKKQNIVRATLDVAFELSLEEMQDIRAKLKEQIKCKELVLHFRQTPKLLGGMILKVGDMVFDSSIATQLNKIKQTIKRGGGK